MDDRVKLAPTASRGGILLKIEKLKDRLLEWDGVDAVDNGEFTEVNYHGVFELLRETADALEQLQAENDRLKRERDAAVKDIWVPRWKSCKFGPDCDFISAVSGFPDCALCGEWTWRGLKEE